MVRIVLPSLSNIDIYVLRGAQSRGQGRYPRIARTWNFNLQLRR
jgi:hypothetical protein